MLSMLTSVTLFGCCGNQNEVGAPDISAAGPSLRVSWNFDDVHAGERPAGWTVEATNPKGAPATWQVEMDSSAPSGDHVLGMTIPDDASGSTFNLCWTDAVSFLDGTIEVRFKAHTGEEDQGGGVIWRARDADNYYIARFNPLENNFRIYTVHDGKRRKLTGATVTLAENQWHTLEIVQHGNRFEGYLDGEKLLEGSDSLFPDAGGVGLWTKADAATSFDDFTVSD
jgi:3-keto-disaccharide hydrolase